MHFSVPGSRALVGAAMLALVAFGQASAAGPAERRLVFPSQGHICVQSSFSSVGARGYVKGDEAARGVFDALKADFEARGLAELGPEQGFEPRLRGPGDRAECDLARGDGVIVVTTTLDREADRYRIEVASRGGRGTVVSQVDRKPALTAHPPPALLDIPEPGFDGLGYRYAYDLRRDGLMLGHRLARRMDFDPRPSSRTRRAGRGP